MSNFPKKGTRKLLVAGKPYLWRINSWDPDYTIDMPFRTEVLVQPEGEGGTIWREDFHGKDNWPAVSPAMVEEIVRERW